MSSIVDPAQDYQPKNSKTDLSGVKKVENDQNADMGGWSFLQSLANSTSFNQTRTKADHTDKIYVHPLVKRSSSKLSEKSLEMCTESLGSETGSESGDEISLLSLESILISPLPKQQGDNFCVKKRTMRRSNSFPPPIKCMSGLNNGGCVRVRSYREDGRLVLRAVKVSSPGSWFQAERTGGRLRLFFFEDSSLEQSANGKSDDEEEGEEQRKNESKESIDKEADERKNAKPYEEDEEALLEETNDDGDGDGDGEKAEEGIYGNNHLEEGKMGTQKFRRLSRRCEDGGHEQKSLLNWEQHWVAT